MKTVVARKPGKSASRNFGFTLIELMVVIVIAAILLAIAVPSFDSLIKKNNVEAMQSKFSSAVSTARTEAASRNTFMTICHSGNGAACGAANGDGVSGWQAGWIVYEDADADGVVDAGEVVVDVFENDASYTISNVGVGAGVNSLTFTSQGFLTPSGTRSFIVCDADKNNQYARGLYINSSGLVVKLKPNDSGNLIEPGSGNTLVCP